MGKMAQWWCKLGTKCKCWGFFQPSYLPEIQIWLVTGHFRHRHVWKESLQHKSTRWYCENLGRWTTIACSKTWAGSATNMWTRCPRQTWSHGSLTIKHYRVPMGNHHRGYRSPCIRYTLRKELLLPEQINQWLGVLGTHMEWRLRACQTITYFAHAWLTWDDSRENKTICLELTAATCTKCTWIRGSHFFHTSISFMNGTRRHCLQNFQH